MPPDRGSAPWSPTPPRRCRRQKRRPVGRAPPARTGRGRARRCGCSARSPRPRSARPLRAPARPPPTRRAECSHGGPGSAAAASAVKRAHASEAMACGADASRTDAEPARPGPRRGCRARRVDDLLGLVEQARRRCHRRGPVAPGASVARPGCRTATPCRRAAARTWGSRPGIATGASGARSRLHFRTVSPLGYVRLS